jgi:hypothetical protein
MARLMSAHFKGSGPKQILCNQYEMSIFMRSQSMVTCWLSSLQEKAKQSLEKK